MPSRAATRPRVSSRFVADFELYVEEGNDKGRFIPLRHATVRLGRQQKGSHEADFVALNDPTMSSHHATLEWVSERAAFHLVHCSQTNHTLVNGRPVEEAYLKPHDTIKMGKVVLRLMPGQTFSGRMLRRHRARRRWRLAAEERILFFHNLGVMLGAGLPLTRCLETLARQTEHPRWEAVLDAMLEMMYQGAPLSRCMAAHSPPFTATEIALVQAGETGGTLAQVLGTQAATRQRELELIRRVRAALTYPLVVLVCGLGSVVLLGHIAFASLIPMLKSTGTELPWVTRCLMALSQGMGRVGVVVPIVLVLGALSGVLRRRLETAEGTLQRDRLALKVPLIGSVLTKVAAVRFCDQLSQLYRSGVPILQGFREAAQACGNVYLAARLREASAALKEGNPLSECLFRSNIMPWSMVSLVDVGEQTGRVDEMLARAARMLDTDVRHSLEQVVNALEPITIAALGFAVGFILLAAFVPIYAVMAHL